LHGHCYAVPSVFTGVFRLRRFPAQHWIAGDETDGEGGFCLIGGLEHLGYKQSLLDKNLPLDEVYVYVGTEDANIDIETTPFSATPEFNDRDGWKPIKTLLTMLAKGVNPREFYIDENGDTFEVSVKKVKF